MRALAVAWAIRLFPCVGQKTGSPARATDLLMNWHIEAPDSTSPPELNRSPFRTIPVISVSPLVREIALSETSTLSIELELVACDIAAGINDRFKGHGMTIELETFRGEFKIAKITGDNRRGVG